MGLGEKKQKVMEYNSQGLPLRTAFTIAEISKHQYYHQPKQGGKAGKKPTTSTTLLNESGESSIVANNMVVEQIKKLHKDPDLAYGYRGTTRALQQEGYLINHKKVYRLMKKHGLLQEKHKTSSKTYVKYRMVQPSKPLEVIEMDLKMVWIERERKHAFILNILDTFSRKWLYQSVSFSITQHQVKQAWEHIIEHHLQPNDLLKKQLHIEIRNDNDKRFSAKMIQEFFKENKLNQVFTHPYTPQENGHVESFHAILSRHLKRFNFWKLDDLEQDLIIFQETYNNQRIHASIAHLSPNDFEQLWQLDLVRTSCNVGTRRLNFKLKTPYFNVKKLTGNNEPEGSSLLDFAKIETEKRGMAPTHSYNLRYKKSPSVVPCNANV